MQQADEFVGRWRRLRRLESRERGSGEARPPAARWRWQRWRCPRLARLGLAGGFIAGRFIARRFIARRPGRDDRVQHQVVLVAALIVFDRGRLFLRLCALDHDQAQRGEGDDAANQRLVRDEVELKQLLHRVTPDQEREQLLLGGVQLQVVQQAVVGAALDHRVARRGERPNVIEW